MIKVMIADDHTLVRQGIRALLEKDKNIEVVAETADGIETIEHLVRDHPDVLVMDISMPNLTGTQVLERMKVENLPGKVVILSMYSDEALISQAIHLGAKAYLLKNSLKEELIQAIQSASQDHLYINTVVSEMLSLERERQPTANPLDMLTNREKEILKMIAEGNTNAAIANYLHLSIKTVEKHRSNLLDKLNIQDTASLIKLAIKYHLVFIEES